MRSNGNVERGLAPWVPSVRFYSLGGLRGWEMGGKTPTLSPSPFLGEGTTAATVGGLERASRMVRANTDGYAVLME